MYLKFKCLMSKSIILVRTCTIIYIVKLQTTKRDLSCGIILTTEPLSQLLLSSIKKLVLVKSSPTLCSLETICRSKKEKARVSTTKNELNSVGLLFFTDRYLDCRQNEFLRIWKKRHLKTKWEHKKSFFFGRKNLTIIIFFLLFR